MRLLRQGRRARVHASEARCCLALSACTQLATWWCAPACSPTLAAISLPNLAASLLTLPHLRPLAALRLPRRTAGRADQHADRVQGRGDLHVPPLVLRGEIMRGGARLASRTRFMRPLRELRHAAAERPALSHEAIKRAITRAQVRPGHAAQRTRLHMLLAAAAAALQHGDRPSAGGWAGEMGQGGSQPGPQPCAGEGGCGQHAAKHMHAHAHAHVHALRGAARETFVWGAM